MLAWFKALMPKEERFFALFAKHATIVLANLRGQREEVHILDLLPRAFDARFLKEASGQK